MANRQTGPVTYRRFEVDPQLSEGLLSVSREGGDLERKVAAGLARLADEAFRFGGRMQERIIEGAAREGEAKGREGAPNPVTVTGGGPEGYRAYVGDGLAQAKALLRDEEGFREQPYWDVSAYRVGYGSDTFTQQDGRSGRVDPNVRVTRADAERDLDYRLSAREGAQVRRQLSGIFDSLPAHAQAALYSVGYNYGSLPDSVVSAARTGDLGAIANAVAGLGANPKRRQREAALIRGGGAAGAPAAGSGVSPSSVGPVRVTPGAPGAFRPRPERSAADRAYNIAGTKTYLEELKFTMLQDQEAVYEAYKNDPVMLEKAMGELEQAHMKDHVFPEIATEYSLDFRKMAYLKIQEARKDAETRQNQQDRLGFLDRVGQFEERKAQALARATAGDEGANLVVLSLQGDIDSHYDSAVARGVLSEQAAAQAKKQSRDVAVIASYVGQANGRTPEEIAAMRMELYERWSRGEEPTIDSAAMGRIDTDLRSAEQTRRTQDAIAEKSLEQRGNDIVNRYSRGQPVPESDMARLQLDAGSTPRGREILQSTLARSRVADALRKLPLSVVEARLESLLKGDGESVNPADLDFARKTISEYRQALQADPIGKAEATGIIPPVAGIPIDGTATAEQIREAIIYRRGAAEAVARHFAVPVRYFRPGEAEAIMSAATQNPEALVVFTQSVMDAFGDRAGVALAEFSETGPALAHAAGIAIGTGDINITRDVAATLAAKQRNELPKLTPEVNRTIDGFGASALSGAFLTNAKTQNAALQTAQLLFEQEAQRRGIDPAEIKTENSPAQALYLRVLDRALGGRVIDGVEYGGIGEVGGRKIIVPPDMRKDEPHELFSNLNDAQLKKLPPIQETNGFRISVTQIRGGNLVSEGDGLYAVALGDPEGDAPRWVLAPNGERWRLDMRSLREIAKSERGNPFGEVNPIGWNVSP